MPCQLKCNKVCISFCYQLEQTWLYRIGITLKQEQKMWHFKPIKYLSNERSFQRGDCCSVDAKGGYGHTEPEPVHTLWGCHQLVLFARQTKWWNSSIMFHEQDNSLMFDDFHLLLKSPQPKHQYFSWIVNQAYRKQNIQRCHSWFCYSIHSHLKCLPPFKSCNLQRFRDLLLVTIVPTLNIEYWLQRVTTKR